MPESPSDTVEPALGGSRRPRELALSAAWHGGLTRTLRTTDGRAVTVIFQGHWSHGTGPDFADAMIEIEGVGLRSGAVELHTRSSEWRAHGHHLDERYNSVILHVVSRVDTAETRRADGANVPVVVLDLPDDVLFAIDARLPGIWEQLGGEVCADDLARRQPERVRAALWHLGDRRFEHRVLRFEGDLCVTPAPDVMLRSLFDAFGYSENRTPMVALAERLIRAGIRTWWPCQSPSSGRAAARRALVLGSAGYLPLAPPDAQISGLRPAAIVETERVWASMAEITGEQPLAPTAWSAARTRPANHPVARLMSLIALLDRTDGDPLAVLLEQVRCRSSVPEALRRLARSPHGPALGTSRAVGIASNVVVPLALAYARHVADHELEDAASDAWARLPVAEWSRPAKRARHQAAGDVTLPRLGERGVQGLLELDRHLCTPRRCHECPVAAEVVRDRQVHPPDRVHHHSVEPT